MPLMSHHSHPTPPSLTSPRPPHPPSPDSEFKYRSLLNSVCLLPSLALHGSSSLFLTPSLFVCMLPAWLLVLNMEPLAVLIPGAYSSFQLYGAYRRWPGYDLSHMQERYDYV
ncbi:unnamed protein product [Discosporangium mesarthrocarpum]